MRKEEIDLIFLKAIASVLFSFAPLTLVTLMNAPAPANYSPPSQFYQLNDAGFSYRWTSDKLVAGRECELYALCAWADVRGPACPGELESALEFFDSQGLLVADGGDIVSERGRGVFQGIEVGTSRDITFTSFNIVDASCNLGVPTGEASL